VDEQTISGFGVIELMGHNAIAGAISEVSIAGSAFLRVDVPALAGQPAFTKFFGGSAIYAITPTDEATARQAAERLAIRPVSLWVVPDGRRELPAPTVKVDEWQYRNVEDEEAGEPDGTSLFDGEDEYAPPLDEGQE